MLREVLERQALHPEISARVGNHPDAGKLMAQHAGARDALVLTCEVTASAAAGHPPGLDWRADDLAPSGDRSRVSRQGGRR